MAMTVRTVTLDPAVVGDAVRAAIMAELLQTVAATVRFLVLNPDTWVAGRFTEAETDTLRLVLDRIETCTPAQLCVQCPLCNGFTCCQGCALESVREVAQATIELAAASPTTETDRQ